MRRGLLVCVVIAVVIAVSAPSAFASFAGSNGNIAFARSGKIVRQTPDGREKVLAKANASAPSYSPNGKKIVFRRNIVLGGWPDPTNFHIWIMNADGSGEKKLTKTAGRYFEPSFSASGKRIIFTVNDGNPMGLLRLYTIGVGGRGMKEFAPNVAGSMQDASWAGKGGKVAYVGGPAGEPAKLRTISATGAASSVKVIAPSLPNAEDPDWSPNGKTIAFVHAPITVNTRRIFRVNADRSGLKKLVDPGAEKGAAGPAWAPDGRRIAYDLTSYTGLSFQLWTMKAGGAGKKKIDSNGFDPTWQAR